MITTVFGPLAPERLGPTDAHTHLFLRSPALPGDAYDDLDRSGEEAGAMFAAGGRTLVDLTPVGIGRDPVKLRRVAEVSGLNVVAATGFHRDAHYPPGHWVNTATVDTLARVILADLTEGIDASDWQGPFLSPTDIRAGVIKLGASYHTISPTEDRRFAAAAQAVSSTGAPIVVHSEIGTHGHEIVDRLTHLGWAGSPLALAHLDRNPDVVLHRELAARGVYLIYDTVGRINYRPDSALLELIGAMCADGFSDRLLLGSDLGRRSSFRAYGGGPGLSYLFAQFAPRLESAIGRAVAHSILIDNPGRAFTAGGR